MRRQMGWVFSISNIGLVIGASIGGWLADRSGRKPVLIGAVAVFGCFTLATALTGDYQSLLAVRFCAGLGFGAALPNLMAIAAEISRPEKAASTAAAMFCGMPFGGGLAALTTQLLPTGFDWRILFVLGGVLPLVLIPALYRWMPETLIRASANRSPRQTGGSGAFWRGARHADAAALARLSPDAADPLSIPELAADPDDRQGVRPARSRHRHRWRSTSAVSRAPC